MKSTILFMATCATQILALSISLPGLPVGLFKSIVLAPPLLESALNHSPFPIAQSVVKHVQTFLNLIVNSGETGEGDDAWEIPTNIKGEYPVRPLFIFNHSDENFKLKRDLAFDTISNGPPFQLPNSTLQNFFFIVPRDANKPSRFLSQLLGLQQSAVETLDLGNSPMAVFVYGISQDSSAEPFDDLARFWLSKWGIDTFLNSVFCNMGIPNSYCVSIRNLDEVHATAFKRTLSGTVMDDHSTGTLGKRQDAESENRDENMADASSENDDDKDDDNKGSQEAADHESADTDSGSEYVFEANLIKQIVDKAAQAKDRTLQLIKDPQPFMDELDRTVDEAIGRVQDRAHYKLQRGANMLAPEYSSDDWHYAFERLDSSDSDLDDDIWKRLDDAEYESIVMPLSFYQQPSRNMKRQESDCKPVTWYNVFHYSIFGSPRFCP